ncbi:MAG: amidohydrolase family protein [Calditrichaeota bacterium]|nr:amidohydrolase family protein [Calditrichota bacterium]
MDAGCWMLVVMLMSLPLWGQKVAVRGETVYTMAGAPLADGVVLIRDGKIEKVGKAAEVKIGNDYTVLSGKVVTPGLIDAHTVVGLAGYYNQPHDQDQLDKSSPIQPELRALDAYNPREKLVEWLRGLGVTTLHTGQAPGALASGQSILVKTVGNTVEEVLLDSAAMVTLTLGSAVSRNYKSPGTSAKGVAMLRTELLKAREYQKKMANKDISKRPARDLKLEALAMVLSGKLPALITANRAVEIMTALRLANEFGFRLILDGAAEAYLVLEEIRAAGVPVIIHPTMARPRGDSRNLSLETAAKLHQAGIPFAFQSGYESYVPKTRVVLFEAAIAAANGLAREDALAALTINSAKILGIDRRVGSLEKGKDADLVIFGGDPFEYTTHVCTVMVDGEVVVQGECH